MLDYRDLRLPELDDVVPPSMRLVNLRFDETRIPDVFDHVLKQRPRIQADLSGRKIGVAVGSRGIANLADIVRAAVRLVQACGGEPLIIPSMGSHGGATADGQKAVLAALGITEKTVGAPIASAMDTRVIGSAPNGLPLVVAETALACDGIVLVNRIKPHTGFKGEVESGLLKMAMIGLGKVAGAVNAHRRRLRDFPEMLQCYFEAFARRVPVVFAVGVVENAYDNTLRAEVIPTERVVDEEKTLLRLAKANLPRLPVKNLDVLIIQEMGKEISGPGIDPNVTGKSNSKDFDRTAANVPDIEKMVCLSLTPASHGNASGVGINDVISKRLFDAMDVATTYRNVITAGVYNSARVPIVMKDDWDAVRLALMPFDRVSCQVAWIRNTLHLRRVAVSKACLAELPDWADVDGEPFELPFVDGMLDVSMLG